MYNIYIYLPSKIFWTVVSSSLMAALTSSVAFIKYCQYPLSEPSDISSRISQPWTLKMEAEMMNKNWYIVLEIGELRPVTYLYPISFWPLRHLITEYWLLIGPEWSRDLNTGLWLVQSDHVTWILASDWSIEASPSITPQIPHALQSKSLANSLIHSLISRYLIAWLIKWWFKQEYTCFWLRQAQSSDYWPWTPSLPWFWFWIMKFIMYLAEWLRVWKKPPNPS